jgi:hypothetical protein
MRNVFLSLYLIQLVPCCPKYLFQFIVPLRITRYCRMLLRAFVLGIVDGVVEVHALVSKVELVSPKSQSCYLLLASLQPRSRRYLSSQRSVLHPWGEASGSLM